MTGTARAPRALVVTIVHRPDDARIAHRQLAALRGAGWEVTFAAPWSATGDTPASWHRAVDLPRAVGRRRLGPVLAARRLLRDAGPRHDVVLLHDPELLLSVAGLRLPAVVWDVHEDPAASISDRAWVPRWAALPLRAAVRVLERWAERRCAELLLAEHGYLGRFRRRHPVVPNVPLVPDAVPPPTDRRVVYVGRLSRSRGVDELLAVGERLAGDVVVELVGDADPDVRPALAAAHERGTVRWHGFLPNDEALQLLHGAAFGLSLLHDEPNFRHSMPTKVLEYLAHGVPVVTTPLPAPMALLQRHGLGTVVPFADVDAVVAAVLEGLADPEGLASRARAGRAAARREDTWATAGPAFVDELRRLVDQRPVRP